MANRNQINNNSIEVTEHDDRIQDVLSNFDIREQRIVLFDYDSVIHQNLYSGKDENGNKLPEYEEKDLEYLFGKLNETTFKILNRVEKYFNVISYYIIVKGKGNFRKRIFSEYKAHRPPPNPLINRLYEYAQVAFKTVSMDNCESDDTLWTISKKIEHTGICLSIDKDIQSIIPGIHYNYNKDIWSRVTEKQSIYNQYRQYVCGDSADGVNFLKGKGIKFYEKTFSIDFTPEEYEKTLYDVYLSYYREPDLALEKMNLCKQLLTLKDMSETKKELNVS